MSLDSQPLRSPRLGLLPLPLDLRELTTRPRCLRVHLSRMNEWMDGDEDEALYAESDVIRVLPGQPNTLSNAL